MASSFEQSAPGHLIIDTGVDSASRREFHADWPVNVNDPQVLREFSSGVIAGKVIGVERSYVDANAVIVTAYSIQLEKVYKGQNIPATISLTLPGGSVRLGEYISSLDKLGLYEMKLGQKDPELLRNAGLDPDQEKDPRTLDPDTLVTENWGMNPTSKSLLAELQPDSWVFYIGAVEGDVYYGAAFDHALSYLKDGMVYGLHPEAERSPIPESELLRG
ncbi:hypothetical protein [Homoserinimonas hongtaonis]|uniref:hypothetical protein n=1 Tax=Homoserinimonas hongtaonis TaxID=2079791 RepID=UPI000D34198E|nr:hypothetical protein [Salinibacterium hongtaonis]AWB88529.1 hypothetical protein C2138_02270 [Salinibacterium hongtaonis]